MGARAKLAAASAICALVVPGQRSRWGSGRVLISGFSFGKPIPTRRTTALLAVVSYIPVHRIQLVDNCTRVMRMQVSERAQRSSAEVQQCDDGLHRRL